VSSIASDDDLLTVPEAAAVLKVSPVTVSRWLRQGRLPAYRLGPRAVRIRRAELAAVFSPARNRLVTTSPPPAAATPAMLAAAGADWDAADFAARLSALSAAAALREQILARRKGSPLPPLDGDRKRGKRS